MMAKTHIVVGISTALTVLLPSDTKTTLSVVAGAVVGSLICDLDCRSQPDMRDAVYGRLIAASILVGVAFLDMILGTGVFLSIANGNWNRQIAAILLFMILCVFVRNSPHRGFSHSLLAMLSGTVLIRIIMPEAAVAFAVAFLSHLLLDILNRRPVRLFFPFRKGFCLNLARVNGMLNRLLLAAGSVWLVAIFTVCVLRGR